MCSTHRKQAAPVIHDWSGTALVSVLFALVAFNPLRIEPNSSEKLVLALVCAVVSITSLRFGRLRGHQTPVHAAALFYLLVTFLSSLLALSPETALIGSTYRSQGWLATALGVMVFWAASQAQTHVRMLMAQTISVITIVFCSIAWFDYAVTPFDSQIMGIGNADFLGDWIAAAFFFFPPLLIRKRSWRWVSVTAIIITIPTLLLVQGGSEFVSLIAAAAIGIVVWVAAQKRSLFNKRWLFGVLLLCVPLFWTGVLWFFQAVWSDGIRSAIWRDSIGILSRIQQPLLSAQNTFDSLAYVRQWLGYGLENIDFLTPHFMITHGLTSGWVDRAHQFFLDSLLQTGILGMIASLAVFGSALVVAFIRLGMLKLKALPSWLFCLTYNVFWVLVIHHLYVPTRFELLPTLIGLSLGMGVFAGAILQVTRERLASTTEPCIQKISLSENIWMVGMIALLMQRWFSLQVGFSLIGTQTLLWVGLGFLSRPHQYSETVPETHPNQVSQILLVLWATFFVVIYSAGWSAEQNTVTFPLLVEVLWGGLTLFAAVMSAKAHNFAGTWKALTTASIGLLAIRLALIYVLNTYIYTPTVISSPLILLGGTSISGALVLIPVMLTAAALSSVHNPEHPPRCVSHFTKPLRLFALTTVLVFYALHTLAFQAVTILPKIVALDSDNSFAAASFENLVHFPSVRTRLALEYSMALYAAGHPDDASALFGSVLEDQPFGALQRNTAAFARFLELPINTQADNLLLNGSFEHGVQGWNREGAYRYRIEDEALAIQLSGSNSSLTLSQIIPATDASRFNIFISVVNETNVYYRITIVVGDGRWSDGIAYVSTITGNSTPQYIVFSGEYDPQWSITRVGLTLDTFQNSPSGWLRIEEFQLWNSS